MFRSLYSKLGLTLVGVFVVLGCSFTLLMSYSMDMYQQEVSQKLHRGIAQYLVDHNDLNIDDQGAGESVNALFESVMIVNPQVEVYLLDEMGFVVACSAKPSELASKQVGLAPILRFLSDEQLPIFGDDPRHAESRKIFSAAEVEAANGEKGYLYVVTGGERHDSLAAMLRGSHILRLSAGGLGLTAIFAVIAGLILFAFLTRRLRRLSTAVSAFEHEGRVDSQALRALAPDPSDEIGRLAVTFRSMAERIASRMGELEQLDRLRRELVANVSHDLRTPLASLQGYLDTVLIKHDDLSEEERRQYLETASRHGHRLASLVGELFELAYLDANDRPPECESFSVEDLVQDVAQEFELETREAGVALDVEQQSDLPFVYGNIGMIERVFENLIKNSLRHTPSGGTVTLALTPCDDAVRVKVIDTGCGISEEDLPYIFDRFYQPHQERDNGGRAGVGLGLAITSRIIELHGSTIEVISRINEGTVFSFDLPTRGGDWADAPAGAYV